MRVSDDFHIHLASRSPRRRQLLGQLGVSFSVLAVDVPERRRPGEPPDGYVRRVAEAKARAGVEASGDERPVLGADTDVVLDGRVLGKPTGAADGVAMLTALAGRSHEVLSAVAVARGGRLESRVQTTRVTFTSLDRATIDAYWATGEPADKAGAYAIQGRAGAFVTRLEGSYSGVMGLPLHETWALLASFGVHPLGAAT